MFRVHQESFTYAGQLLRTIWNYDIVKKKKILAHTKEKKIAGFLILPVVGPFSLSLSSLWSSNKIKKLCGLFFFQLKKKKKKKRDVYYRVTNGKKKIANKEFFSSPSGSSISFKFYDRQEKKQQQQLTIQNNQTFDFTQTQGKSVLVQLTQAPKKIMKQ